MIASISRGIICPFARRALREDHTAAHGYRGVAARARARTIRTGIPRQRHRWRCVASLTTEDLGIASVGHRRRLLEAIVAPREGDEPTRPTAVADAAPSGLVMAGDRGSRAGKAFENAVLIAPATGELGIACR